MNLSQLKYFQCVAQLGSFTRAANALGVAQPALSRQIRRLEVELGHSLLNRDGRGASTTEVGKLLLSHCDGILRQVARAKEDVSRVRGKLVGRVAVGLTPSAARIMAVPLTREVKSQLPQVALSMSEAFSPTLLEWLLLGRIDLAIVYNPEPSSKIKITPLAVEPLCLIAPRGHHPLPKENVTLAALAKFPLVIPNRASTIRITLERQMSRLGVQPKISVEVDSVQTILELVAAGSGYAVLTERAVRTSVKPSRYIVTPIVEPPILSRLCAAASTGWATTLAQTTTLRIATQVAQKAYAGRYAPA